MFQDSLDRYRRHTLCKPCSCLCQVQGGGRTGGWALTSEMKTKEIEQPDVNLIQSREQEKVLRCWCAQWVHQLQQEPDLRLVGLEVGSVSVWPFALILCVL